MLAPSRSLLCFLRQSTPFKSSQCQLIKIRTFSAAVRVQSGHSRWSKIKHDKAKEDAKKNKMRSVLSHEIALASQLYGPDPNANPRLKTAIEKAKTQRFPKESISSAILRGQGQSASGKPLESVTIEFVFPPGIAGIVECQTESKLRTLTEVRAVITKGGGQPSPTSYLFERRGKVVFKLRDGVSGDELMESALEVEGLIDIVGEEEGNGDVEEGNVEVITEPTATKAVADAIVENLGLEIQSLDIEWQPSTIMELQTEEYDRINEVVQKLEDISEVQDVYLNI